MVREQDWTNFALQRPNYFPGQYLLDEDFELAHRYLSDRQRYINSKLHLAGIVEGLEVEAVSGQTAVTIQPGAAIDGEGNLIILTEATTRPINSPGWLCLRYHQEAQVLQQPEIPDSFTRFVETPLLTLEAIETRDAKTVILAQLTPEAGQIIIDLNVRHYSGVRLPSGQAQEIALRSDGSSLAIQGNLTIDGTLKLGNHSILSRISESIDRVSDRTDVIPSEKAVKAHIEERITERITPPEDATEELPTISLVPQKDGLLYGWKTEGGNAADPSAMIQLIAYRASVASPRLVIERDTGNVGIGTAQPARTLDVNGTIRAHHVESTNLMQYRIYPDNPIVYQDIFEAKKAGVIQKYRQPKTYDETTYAPGKALLFDRPGICYGYKETDDSGALVTIPAGYDTVWVRVPGDMWYVIKAQFRDGDKEDLGYWAAGRREGNCYCPDGSLSDGYAAKQQWVPIPTRRSGDLILTDRPHNYSNRSAIWFTGLAFSKNPWMHATQSALGYHWAVNTGQAARWGNDGWSGDIYAYIDAKTNLELMVPYVWSGQDKLLYVVEHNNTWNGCMHNGITVNGKPIERFLATYDNPFARHWNSKTNNRYIAARIPADLIPKPTADTPPLLKVQVDMSKQDAAIHFREIGTHDLEVPDMV